MERTQVVRPRRRSGAVAAILTGLLLLVAQAPIKAFDVEVHYAWTYYLALQVGYTPRQAFQIASGDVAVDGDLDTDPMFDVTAREVITGAGTSKVFALYFTAPIEITPNRRIVNVWSKLHAFAETQLVRSGRRIDQVTGPRPEEIARVADVQAVREENQRALWAIGMREGNPGAFLHFMQDSFSHGPYDNLRGHALHGHAPDFLSNRPSLSWQMTLRTLSYLRQFMQKTGNRERIVDEARIRTVLDRMVAANPRRWVVNPTLYDAALDGVFSGVNSVLDWVGLPGAIPSVSGVGSPSAADAWRVVNQAIEEDRLAGRLPSFPEVWFNERPPAEWLQYDYLPDGQTSNGGMNRNRFPVERARIVLGAPVATFRPVEGSPNAAQVVTLRVSYTVEGLASLPFLNPLPVIEDTAVSDSGVMPRRRTERGNGTYTIEREIQRGASALASGELRWSVSVHGYGLEPQETSMSVQFRPGSPLTSSPPPAAPCRMIPGVWSWFINGDVTFRADASLTQGQLTGRWSCSDADRTVTIVWSHGFTDHLVLSPDGTRLSGTNNARNGVSGQRKGDAPGRNPEPKPAPWWYVICGGDVMRTPVGPPAGDSWKGTYPAPNGGPGWVFDLRKTGTSWTGDGYRFGQPAQNKTPCHAEIR